MSRIVRVPEITPQSLEAERVQSARGFLLVGPEFVGQSSGSEGDGGLGRTWQNLAPAGSGAGAGWGENVLSGPTMGQSRMGR